MSRAATYSLNALEEQSHTIDKACGTPAPALVLEAAVPPTSRSAEHHRDPWPALRGRLPLAASTPGHGPRQSKAFGDIRGDIGVVVHDGGGPT